MTQHDDQFQFPAVSGDTEFGPRWIDPETDIISPLWALGVAAVLAVPLLALARIVPPFLFVLLGILELVIAVAAWRSICRGSTHLSCMARTAVIVCAGTQLIGYAWMGGHLLGMVGPKVAKPADWRAHPVQPAANPNRQPIPRIQLEGPPVAGLDLAPEDPTNQQVETVRAQRLQLEDGQGIPATRIFQLRYSEVLEPQP